MILLAAPLILVSLAFTVFAFAGLGVLPGAEQAALPAEALRAGLSALLALALAAPVAARRIAVAWALPLAILPGAGATGWSLLPLPHFPGDTILEGAVLLLPATVFVLRGAWRGLPPGLRETARAQGASPWQALWHGAVSPALPGGATALLVAFMLGLGLAPLLAPHTNAP